MTTFLIRSLRDDIKLIVIQFMFLGLTARPKMSRAQNIVMSANINSIVLL